MKTDAQVVVIGGGVVGCSILYHLTKAGWTDVVLLERAELTSGSTWHSAGGMHTLNGDPNVAKLQQYTIELYEEIEKVSGQDCGIHITGGVMLADTPERMDWLRMSHARGRYLGMETELISVAEAKELLPIFEEKYFVGAMYDAHEGHVDPSGVTHAYAKVARQAGAEIYRSTWAHNITRATDGDWDVHVGKTELGNPANIIEDLGVIHCEHVVNAGGLWAREVGRMVGLELPVLAMEHMYLLTEDIPAVAEYNEKNGEMLHAIDFGGEIYMRQEAGGLLLGTYERKGKPWSPKETPWDFGMRLLEPDLDRIADSLDVGFQHFPIFAEAGIKQVINGPFTFSPDGNPLLGPTRGLPGYWSACAVMAGLSQGGGVGLALANWMTDGDPGFDVWGMDVARFGDYANLSYTNEKVRENYGRRFRITFPNEHLKAARPLITSPIYDRLIEHNAVWGSSFGLETALWFAPEGTQPEETITFKRSNAWDSVAAEVAAVRDGVGLYESTGFAKYRITGPGARQWLDRVLANRMPSAGRIVLTPMLNHAGKLIGDFTVSCLSSVHGEEFFVFGSGVAERYHERWFERNCPADGSVIFETLGMQWAGLSLAGPQSRDVLRSLVDDDVSAEAFGFMRTRWMDIGNVSCVVGKITFTGDLGYEIWMPAQYQRILFDKVLAAGEPHGVRLFGGHALNSLRLDKNFGTWAREFRPIYGPYEAGLGAFVKLDKEFIGRDAAAAEKDVGPERRLLSFVVDAEDADVIGDEPIWFDHEVVGWVTSGGYAHHSRRSVAMGYVPARFESDEDRFEIEVLGVRRKATRLDAPLFDPDGGRMRS
ncbi:MAG: GcvT family protein [Acidimicrobiales bacterium]|nr:GcvT family protein [Acidimicrobiales bacterium]